MRGVDGRLSIKSSIFIFRLTFGLKRGRFEGKEGYFESDILTSWIFREKINRLPPLSREDATAPLPEGTPLGRAGEREIFVFCSILSARSQERAGPCTEMSRISCELKFYGSDREPDG